MKKLFALSALTLTACGGGGSSETTTKPTIASAPPSASAPQEVIYYKELKNIIPNLSLYYNKTCGREANSFMLPSIDANKDGRKDLFIALWCGVPEYGMVYEGPVKNTVISLIQNNDGTFRLGNQELFGRDFIEITGAMGEGGDVGVGDFNGDGKEDIAFSPALEDGRKFVVYANGRHSWETKLTVIMSNGDSGYRVDIVGDTWGYESLAIVKGKDRDKFTSGGRVWSYQNNQWTGELLNYKTDRTSLFFDNYMTMNVFDGKSIGWQIGTLNGTESFTQTEYSHLSDLRTVKVYNDNIKGDTNEYLATIDNIDYLMPGFNSICTMPGSNSNETIIMAELQAIKLTEKYTGQKLEWSTPGKDGNVTWANNITKIIAYKVSNGKLTRLDVPALNKDITNTHYLNCTDVNGDKKNDLVVYRWGHKQEKSVIFLATDSGFTEVSSDKIPNVTTLYHGHNVLMADFDNDGKSEIIYGPGLGYKSGYAGTYDDYQFFKSISPL